MIIGAKQLAGGAAAACATALGIASGAAQADINNLAVCHSSLDIAMQAGSFTAGDGAALDCSGMVQGQLVSSGGSIQMWGHYSTAKRGSQCIVSFADTVFSAQVREAIALIDEGTLPAEGGISMSTGPMMTLSGSGSTEDQAILVRGMASFTPAGASCSTLNAGTLSVTFTLTDGGDGNPGAQTAVTSYLTASASASAPSSAGSAPAERRGQVHRHRRHGRRALRHIRKMP
ncbi:MAG: hypothetical protein ACYDHH_19610 [Solirubrobacteraceae bacterium]